ncbi:hypothetical protein OAP18_03630 [Gammaproteobacteria bacterium]|nr:hypothetical protein [Gammaproteobacteria bacterium]
MTLATARGKVKPPTSTTTTSRLTYTPINDKTLTDKQAKQKGFRPDYLSSGKSFRFPSNLTKNSYSTGYHESFVTTDTAVMLKSAYNAKQSSMTFQSKSKVFAPYVNKSVSTQRVENMIEIGDGLRTDTAQTILTYDKGSAGHTGSNVNQTGQSKGHDYLRISNMNVMYDTNVVPETIAVIGAAVTVNSIAPAVEANKIKNIKNLKANGVSKSYEHQRNVSKTRVNHLFQKLPQKQQQLAIHHISEHYSNMNPKNSGRKLALNRPTSPRRIESTPSQFLQGGNYDTSKTGFSPPQINIDQKAALREKAMYATQPFRANRRN